jgi:hypothetical protein
MNYFVNDDCFSDLYQDGCPYASGPLMDPLLDEQEMPVGSGETRIEMERQPRIGPFPLRAVSERGGTSYELDVYESAVRSFIQYLEAKEMDLDWLMDNQDLVIELFDVLIEMGDSEDMLPALQILEQDPRFSEILDENALKVMIQHTMAG